MKLLAKITDKLVTGKEINFNHLKANKRRAARVILLKRILQNNKIL